MTGRAKLTAEEREHAEGHPSTPRRTCRECRNEWARIRGKRRRGATYAPLTAEDILSVHAELFWARVEKTDTCWNWRGQATKYGYGTYAIPSRRTNTSAHRIAWVLTGRPLDPAKELDHVCRNRLCVNPLHLEQVSGAVNNSRSASPTALNARKTHCAHGHAFTPENTYTPPSGGRYCRECRRLADQRRRHASAV